MKTLLIALSASILAGLWLSTVLTSALQALGALP